MNAIVEHWKTSVCGVAVLAVTAAFLIKAITLNEYIAVIGVLASGGLFLAADGKK